MAANKRDWELRVVVGPSGSGRRTRLGFLQEYFGFMGITLVQPKMLCPIVQKIFDIHGDKPFRLAIEIAAVPFRAEGFKSQYESFVDDCVSEFTKLKNVFDGELKIIFMYCDQAELAQHQSYNYHPLMELFGDMQTAIFADCMIHLNLMLKMWERTDEFPIEEAMIFSDRTGQTIEQLRGEISERRYKKRPAGPAPEEEPPGFREDEERKTTEAVKGIIEDINKALADAETELAEKRRLLVENQKKAKAARDARRRAQRDKPNEEAKKSEVTDELEELIPELASVDDILTLPVEGERLDSRRHGFVTRGWNRMRRTLVEIGRARDLIIGDKSMDLSVLLLGESGSGKEGIAAFLHYCKDKRRKFSFITIDCTSIQQGLLESELFGVVKGAFTGADRDRRGLVSLAANGTLFLDEIGLMDLGLQAKLLRFIETRTFRRVGAINEEYVPNCRIIAATSRNLSKAVAEGAFLVDLYNRLKAITIALPPMRERREDIPLLFKTYASNVQFSDSALALLFDYNWPGNIRELKQVALTYQTAAEGQKRHKYDPNTKLNVSANMLIKDFAATVTKAYIESALQYRWAMLDISREARRRAYQQLLLESVRSGKIEADIKDVQERGEPVPQQEGAFELASRERAAERSEESFRRLMKEHIKDNTYKDIHSKVQIEALIEVLRTHGWKWMEAGTQTGINRETIKMLITKHVLKAIASTDDLSQAQEKTNIEMDRLLIIGAEGLHAVLAKKAWIWSDASKETGIKEETIRSLMKRYVEEALSQGRHDHLTIGEISRKWDIPVNIFEQLCPQNSRPATP
jgi:DNA-binding NtrC family response regulator